MAKLVCFLLCFIIFSADALFAQEASIGPSGVTPAVFESPDDYFPSKCDPSEPSWMKAIPWGDETVSDSACQSWLDKLLTPEGAKDAVRKTVGGIAVKCNEAFKPQIAAFQEVNRAFQSQLAKQKPASADDMRDFITKSIEVAVDAAGKGLKPTLVLELQKILLRCSAEGVVLSAPIGIDPEARQAMVDFTGAVLDTVSFGEATKSFHDAYRAFDGSLKDHKPSALYNLVWGNRDYKNWINSSVQSYRYDSMIEGCELDHTKLGIFRDKVIAEYIQELQKGRQTESLARQTLRCYFHTHKHNWKQTRSYIAGFANELKRANRRNCLISKYIKEFQQSEKLIAEKEETRASRLNELKTLERKMGDAAKACDISTLNNLKGDMLLKVQEECLWDYDKRYVESFARRLVNPDPKALEAGRSLLRKVQSANRHCKLTIAHPEGSRSSVGAGIAELRKMSGYTEWRCLVDLKPEVLDPLEPAYLKNKTQRAALEAVPRNFAGLIETVKQDCDFESRLARLDQARADFVAANADERCLHQGDRNFLDRVDNYKDKLTTFQAEVLVAQAKSLNEIKSHIVGLEDRLGALVAKQDASRCGEIRKLIDGVPEWVRSMQTLYGSTGMKVGACPDLAETAEWRGRLDAVFADANAALLNDRGFFAKAERLAAVVQSCDIPGIEAELSELGELGELAGVCNAELVTRVTALRTQAEGTLNLVQSVSTDIQNRFQKAKAAYSSCNFQDLPDLPEADECVLRNLKKEQAQAYNDVSRLKRDAAEVERARAALRAATQNTPTLIEICRIHGGETELGTRAAARHANFLKSSPYLCIQESPEVLDYEALKARIASKGAEYETLQRAYLEQIDQFARRLRQIQDEAKGADEVRISELNAEIRRLREKANALRAKSEPQECFEGFQSSFAKLHFPELRVQFAHNEQSDRGDVGSIEDEFDPLADDSFASGDEMGDFFASDNDTGVENLARERSRRERELGRSRDRVAIANSDLRRRDPANYGSANRGHYERAVDEGRRREGGNPFYQGGAGLRNPGTGSGNAPTISAPTGQSRTPLAGNKTVRGSAGEIGGGGNQNYDCYQMCKAASDEQFRRLKLKPDSSPQARESYDKGIELCVDSCKRKPTSHKGAGCVTSCMRSEENRKRFGDGWRIAKHCNQYCIN